jgi:hypothetical protein
MKIIIILIFCITLPLLLIGDMAPDWSFNQKFTPIAKSSSELSENKRSYIANNSIDNNLLTAWCEGVKGSGIGETIEVKFSPTAGKGISVFSGIGVSKKLYYDNNRIKEYEAIITFKNGRQEKIKGKFEDDLCGFGDDRECLDFNEDEKKYDACIKRLTSLCHYNNYNQSGQIFLSKIQCITKFQLKIMSVYKGKKYDDTCISEINIFKPLGSYLSIDEQSAFEKFEKSCN